MKLKILTTHEYLDKMVESLPKISLMFYIMFIRSMNPI